MSCNRQKIIIKFHQASKQHCTTCHGQAYNPKSNLFHVLLRYAQSTLVSGQRRNVKKAKLKKLGNFHTKMRELTGDFGCLYQYHNC